MHKMSVILLSTMTLMSCSHSTHSKKSPLLVSKHSFTEIIKSKGGKLAKSKRVPASRRNIPGSVEFMEALKKNPEFLKVPIGYEVITSGVGFDEEDGELSSHTYREVFLKDNDQGYFTLSLYEKSISFKLDHYDAYEDVKEDLLQAEDIQSFEKISPTKFIMHYELSFTEKLSGQCQSTIDLTKSEKLTSSICRDKDGATLYEYQVFSIKPIKVEDYAKYLKDISLDISSDAIPCQSEDGGIEPRCSSSISTPKEDWSYILK